jgi:hypothetical protein
MCITGYAVSVEVANTVVLSWEFPRAGSEEVEREL